MPPELQAGLATLPLLHEPEAELPEWHDEPMLTDTSPSGKITGVVYLFLFVSCVAIIPPLLKNIYNLTITVPVRDSGNRFLSSACSQNQ